MPSTDRITEILKQPLKEVNNTASLLGVQRYEGETEDTWRTRVAYKMQEKIYKAEGRILSPKILERIKNWELKALAEKEN